VACTPGRPGPGPMAQSTASLTPSRRGDLPRTAVTGLLATRGSAGRTRLGPAPGCPCPRTTIQAGPGGRVRMHFTPITPAGPAARTRAGPAPKRSCGRMTTPAGPNARSRPGAMPNRRSRGTMTAAGPAATAPRDGNHHPALSAARARRQRHARSRDCRSGCGGPSGRLRWAGAQLLHACDEHRGPARAPGRSRCPEVRRGGPAASMASRSRRHLRLTSGLSARWPSQGGSSTYSSR
jgi:hypothetical protein